MSHPVSGAEGQEAIDNRAIEQIFREIGADQLRGYRTMEKKNISVKEDRDHGFSVVTEYDIQSERRMQAFLEERFPGDSFLGEELGNRKRDTGRYWIFDPIDGTSNFTQGIPFWGPSLAFWDRRGPVQGWIYFPALDQMFRASRGGGSFRDGRPLETSTVSEYSNLCTVATVSRMHRKFRLTCPAKHRIPGSIIANLTFLAAGTFAAIYCKGSLWDVAAGILIAREAGAVVECDPPLESIDPAAIDPRKPETSRPITVYGTANTALPGFRRYIVPLESPIQGR